MKLLTTFQRSFPYNMVNTSMRCNPDSNSDSTASTRQQSVKNLLFQNSNSPSNPWKKTSIYARCGACGLSIILNIATITVALMIAPFTGTYHAIMSMQITAQLPTINPDTGIFNP